MNSNIPPKSSAMASRSDEVTTPSRPPDAQREESPTADASEHYWDYCPNCSSRLHNRGCKYRCTRCHYFMSCSDFD